MHTRAIASSPLRLRALGLALALLPVPAAAADAAATAAPAGPAWEDITNDLGGTTWGQGGIGTLGIAPDSGALIAGVAGAGLWQSTDSGRSWQALGAVANTKGRPSCLVFDPTTTATFWFSLDDGTPALFATTDAGKTFKQLGNLPGVASFAVDTSDAKHRLIIAGMSKRERDVELSSSGSFSRTYKLPADLGYTREVVLLDAKTLLVGSAGKDPKTRQDRENGIFKSDDGGKSWTKVSTSEPTSHALVLSDGTILWPSGDHEAIQRSKDRGLTWNAVTSARIAPMQLTAPWLAAVGDSQLMLSSDGGATWDPVGPQLPFQADGAAWDGKHKAFVVWHATGGQEKGSILRLQAPDDFSFLVEPTQPRDLVAWDGDDKSAGGGWAGSNMTITRETSVARQGQGAMQWHVDLKSFFTNAGWVWGTYPLSDAATIDASADTKLVLSLKLVGNGKDPAPAGSKDPAPGLPTALTITLSSLSGGAASESKAPAALLTLQPKLYDGKWHDVVVPLSTFTGLDTKKIIGFTLTANNGGNNFNFDLYIDNIGFSK